MFISELNLKSLLAGVLWGEIKLQISVHQDEDTPKCK